MVVKITSPDSLQRALNYNEKKVQKGQAECIHAGNYLLSPEQMNFNQKMERMAELNALNERTRKTNTLHISLNFDPSEKHSNEKLGAIANSYMEKIGFGDQPYLVYRHDDAGHPHIHIVTSTIREDGQRIDTYNIGRNQSEKARKEIERDFGLVKAGQKKDQSTDKILAVDVRKVQYGKVETKRSIQNVLEVVIPQYKYTSLEELNAVLRQYNITADRGDENGRIYQKGGLMYSLLDEKGNKTGIPVKASTFHNKPTLANLEKRFEENEQKRLPDKQKLKTSIEWVLSKDPGSLKGLCDALTKEKIQVVMRQNKEGRVYGITFIDYRTKAVFNGSDLGKQYSIGNIQKRLNLPTETPPVQQKTEKLPKGKSEQQDILRQPEKEKQPQQELKHNQQELLSELLKSNRTFNHVPADLLKKKRKRRNLNL